MMKQATRILFTLLVFIQTISSAQKLQTNDKAPNLKRISVQGDTINLNDLKNKTVLLTFFRYTSCPACNFRVHELLSHYNQLQAKNIDVIVVFESKKETIKSYLKDTPVPFPIISNPDLKLYKAYGVEKSFYKTIGTLFNKKTKRTLKEGKTLYKAKQKKDGSATRMPADFIIENGIVKTAHYGNTISDHISIETLLTP